MKTQNLKLIILTFGIVFLSSCTNSLYTSLDVLRPAKVSFAQNANNLLIVNNTAKQPDNMGHRTELLNQKTKNILVETDSIPLFCLGALTEELETNGFFTSVKLQPNSFNKSNSFSIIEPINTDNATSLCVQNHADVLLSLDKIKVNDDISEYYINETSAFQAVFEVRYESYWSIHYPNKEEVTPIQFKDTIYWQSDSYARKTLMNQLPKRIDGIIDGALNVGKKSVSRFLPFWEKADRFFYTTPNKYIKQGMDSVYTKNWKFAISAWEKAYKSKSSLVQAYAANNIAIAYEISGDVAKAIEYSTLAYYSLGKSFFSENTVLMQFQNYLEELNQRKIDIEILKNQLGE